MSSNFLCGVNEWTVLAINKNLIWEITNGLTYIGWPSIKSQTLADISQVSNVQST